MQPNSCMRKFSFILLLNLFVGIHGWAADEFATVQCGADVPKAMLGSRSSNERVVILEERHKSLGLKDLGGMEISDRLFLNSWRICGTEYAVLLNTGKHAVRDVLPLPAHSLLSPLSFVEKCEVAKKEIQHAVIAILDNSQSKISKLSGREILLPAKTAWKIDSGQERFVAMPVQGLSCAVSRSSVDLKQ